MQTWVRNPHAVAVDSLKHTDKRIALIFGFAELIKVCEDIKQNLPTKLIW